MEATVPNKLKGEHRISVQELAKRERVAGCTVHRWISRGAYGAKLESFLVGGIRYTTDEAFQRFIQT